MSGGVEDFDIGRTANMSFDFIVGHVYKVTAEWYEDQDARIEDGSPCAEITHAEFCFPGTCMKSCLDEWMSFDLERHERRTLRRMNANFFDVQDPEV